MKHATIPAGPAQNGIPSRFYVYRGSKPNAEPSPEERALAERARANGKLSAAKKHTGYRERLDTFTRLRDDGKSIAEAGEAVGIAPSTACRYERTRRGAVSRGSEGG